MKKLSLLLFAITLVFKTFSQEVITTRQICNHTIPFHRMVEVQNRHEYHSNLGITYIEELDSNGNLKSTSFWIGETPVYRMILSDDEGRMTNIFNKRVGRFDLCHVLNRIQNDPNLRYGDDVRISLGRDSWAITDTRYGGAKVNTIHINRENGEEEFWGVWQSIYLIPCYLYYEGGREQMRVDLMNLMTIHPDLLQNMTVNVFFDVSDEGVISNIRLQNPDISEYIKNQIFDAMKRLPNNWRHSQGCMRDVIVPPLPPLISNDSVVSNYQISEPDTEIHQKITSLIFRRFEASNSVVNEPDIEVEQILHRKSISLIFRRFTPHFNH